jgi:hypothetical protein
MTVARSIFSLAALALLSTTVQAEVIRDLKGSREATIVEMSVGKDGELEVKTNAGTQRLALIRSIEFNSADRVIDQESATFILTNGDRLRGRIASGDAEGLKVKTASLGSIDLPLEALRAVVLDPTADFREVEKTLRSTSDKDLFFLKSGSQTAGVLEELDGKRVIVAIDDDTPLKIKLDKLRMIVLALVEEPTALPAGSHVKLRLLDGVELHGTLSSFREGVLRLRHPLSDKLEVRGTDVQQLTVLNGATIYLSDQTPTQVDQGFPEGFRYYPEVFGWKRDRSVLGGLLKLGGRSYDKGLGTHSYCALTYALDGRYGSFAAVVGLDDSARFLGAPGVGSVRFRVLVDGKPATEYPDGLLAKKGGEAQPIEVSLLGAKTLTLVSDYGSFLHILGRANWADAYLIKARPKANAKPNSGE